MAVDHLVPDSGLKKEEDNICGGGLRIFFLAELYIMYIVCTAASVQQIRADLLQVLS